jgi:hypothetical protein
MLRDMVCVFLIRRVEHSIQRRSTSNCPAIETSGIFVFNLTDYGYEEPVTPRPPFVAEEDGGRGEKLSLCSTQIAGKAGCLCLEWGVHVLI